MENQPRPRAKERACDEAIKGTLRYRAIFKYPMSFFQLQTYLICKKGFEYDFFKKAVKKLHKKNFIRAKEEKFSLPTVKPLSWELRSRCSKEHIQKCQPIFSTLSAIPWIKMLAVTGSVAAYNSDKKDDIDIFIITEKNRLWLTRFFMVLILKILGSYRTESNPEGKICPNILIDETSMEWPEEKRSVYTAHEIVMMHPFINREETYFRFLKKNKWALEYFGNLTINLPEKFKKNTRERSGFVDLLEKLSHRMQSRYMKKRQTTEVTTKNFIHFNKYDWAPKILNEYSLRE